VGKHAGRHRAKRTPKVTPMAGAAGVAAAAGAVAMGFTPTLTASPQLLADNENTVWYLRGTEIGDNPTDPEYEQFIGRMVEGSDVDDPGSKTKVNYPASFFPVTTGYLTAPTFDQSVGEGLANLESKPVQQGDVIFGFSQGAVVASEYKGKHPNQGVTYVLVENPDRPNGGILARFDGVSIPILGVTANGATPATSDKTIDISRQYDGWSDFPAYPLNVVADANAILGIYYLHGKTQSDVESGELTALRENAPAGGNMYYQNDTSTNTEYYLIPTDRLPLLMPFEGIVPEPILDAADPPLRVIVELGYDRSDYGKPTTAGIAPAVNPVTVATDLANATGDGINKGLAGSGVATPNLLSANTSAPKPSSTPSVASLTNLSARGRTTPNTLAGTPEVKLPTLTPNTQKPGTAAKPAASTAKPFSPKDVVDNVKRAMGVKNDTSNDKTSDES
jgi:hypothetical protein